MSRTSVRPILAAAVLATSAWIAACGSAAGAELRSVYTNAEGNTSIEFMEGGKAHFSSHGMGGECTYTQNGNKVVLTCEDEPTEFTVGEDGALTGPPDSFMTRMKKKS